MTLQEFKQRYRYDANKDLIGKGGFAKVYRAYDTLMNRTVALKFYHGDLEAKYDVLSELKKVTTFKHPNLVRYYDATVLQALQTVYGTSSNMQVGILEYANAGDLNDFIKTFPELEQIDEVLRGLLKGLQYLHQNGVIHRDIKPQNVLMSKTEGAEEKWTTKIADFGLAKKIDQGQVSSKLLGTMEYMAPEQFNPQRFGIQGALSTNVDLWAFGVILFELFTGELPFGSRHDGLSHEEVMLKIMSEDLSETALNEVEQPYQNIIRRCLVKPALNRALNAQELLDLWSGKSASNTVNSTISTTQGHKDLKAFTKGQKRALFIGNILLSPILGIVGYLFWRKSKPLKSQEALSIAWWSLAAWLGVLVLIVGGLIVFEYLNLMD
ncbi:MAG: serine/threonine-protein kinase [Chitinophagales bacterium]